MTESSSSGSGPNGRGGSNVAYTRAAVNQYLDDVARRRAELERAITEARGRTARAELAITRLNALEHAVGASLVAAYARQVTVARRRGQVHPVYEAPREKVIDLRVAEAAPDDEEDGLAALGGEFPDDFGDEFFGPLRSVTTNGTRPPAQVQHG